jgi:hypothetical protein
MFRTVRTSVFASALACAATLVLHADDAAPTHDDVLQFQLGTVFFDDTKYYEAMDAFRRAEKATKDPLLALRARKGRVKSRRRTRRQSSCGGMRRGIPRS